MKFLTIALALSGVATASLGAQVELPARAGVVLAPASQRRTDCTYARTTNGVGDIIFGRTSIATNCRDVYSREGRNPHGTFTIFDTRVANANDKEWRKAQKAQQKALKKQEKAEDKQMKGQLSKQDYKDWKKQEKAENKAVDANFKASMKANKGKNK